MNNLGFNNLPDQLIVQMFDSNIGSAMQINKNFNRIFNKEFENLNNALALNNSNIANIIKDIKDLSPLSITKLIFEHFNNIAKEKSIYLRANLLLNEKKVSFVFASLRILPNYIKEIEDDHDTQADDFRYFMTCVEVHKAELSLMTLSGDDLINSVLMNKNPQRKEGEDRYPEDLHAWPQVPKWTKAISIPSSVRKLTYLPKEIGELTKLETLDLNGHKLKLFPIQLKDLKLSTLILNNNPLRIIPAVIFKINTLKNLSLAHCQLPLLPEEFGYLTQLETLDLSHNKLRALPSSFKNLKQIKKLDISSNPWEKFPILIEGLPNLTKLIAKGIKKEDVSEKILNNPNMRVVGEGWKKKRASAFAKFKMKFNNSYKSI